MLTIALVGNPNCGKSTLFNRLTGGQQPVGNWSGVTVECATGQFSEGNTTAQVVDLPGMYAFSEQSDTQAIDECIACDFIVNKKADVIVNVVDASRLERHLYLTQQLLETGTPVIVALNMMDVAAVQHIQVDVAALSLALGCPVIPLEAYRGKGLQALKVAMLQTPPAPVSLTERSAAERYAVVDDILARCVSRSVPATTSWTMRIDRIVLSRVWGIPIFLGMMYALFAFAMGVGGYLQTYFDQVSQFLFVDGLAQLLQSMHAPAWLIAISAEGIGKGLNTMMSFIPVIGMMFLFLSLLEDSGYMSRAAFVIDRCMRVLGLPGKAFVPMIIGFGCNVPAVMAARTLSHRRDRILTILMTPFMSCSARLAIFAVFTSAFFTHGGQNVVFMLYVIGILMAILTGFILQRTLLKGQPAPLLMELPSYHIPHWPSLLKNAWRRLQGFILRAGQLIVPICAVMGWLNAGVGDTHSLLATLGRGLTPLFAPMGIQADNWPATVGLLTGVLAKEVVVGTLNTLYESRAAFGSMAQHFDGQIGAMAYLLFVLLYFPCVSTMAVMLRELYRGWVIFSAIWMTGIAYGVAVLFYQLATWGRHPWASTYWVSGILLGFFLTIMMIRRLAVSQKGMKPLPLEGGGCVTPCVTCPEGGAIMKGESV